MPSLLQLHMLSCRSHVNHCYQVARVMACLLLGVAVRQLAQQRQQQHVVRCPVVPVSLCLKSRCCSWMSSSRLRVIKTVGQL